MTINGYVARWFLTYLSEGAKVPRKDVETKRSGKIMAEKMSAVSQALVPTAIKTLHLGLVFAILTNTFRPDLMAERQRWRDISSPKRHARL
jgi:hypothetical protein